MDKYLFGQSISRAFFALQDNEPVNIPSQAPTLYLFTDRPTFSAASIGTNALQTKAYWTHSDTSPYPRYYTWDPVPNPSPNGGEYVKQYWEGINWYNDLAHQIQTIIRPLELEAAQELDSIPGTSVQDIKDVYPKIGAYLSDSELGAHLTIAIDEFKNDLEAKGIEYHQVSKLRKVKYALAYKAISVSSLSQIQEVNDKHYIRWETYDNMYRSLLSRISMPVDRDGDNLPDETVSGTITELINER